MTDFARARQLLASAIADRVFPGAAFGVLHGDGALTTGVAGNFTYDDASPAVSAATLFDLASLTKVMVTTAIAMVLWQQEELDLETPVADLLPAFRSADPRSADLRSDDPRRQNVTLAMLLAHSSGLPAHRKLYQLPSVEHVQSAQQKKQAALAACLATPLLRRPGDQADYSDIGFIVLGQALLALTGADDLQILWRRLIADKLALSACFCPPPELQPFCAPTCDWNWRHRPLQGEPQDENCAVLGGISGHAGLFSTCRDVLRFAKAILQPHTIFAPRTVHHFSQIRSGSRTLGWDTPTPPSQAGRFFSPHSIGHLGYTGASLWIDPSPPAPTQPIAIVLLTNRAYTGPQAPPMHDPAAISRFRPAFHDAILRDLLGLKQD